MLPFSLEAEVFP